jgi:hypothetical protein
MHARTRAVASFACLALAGLLGTLPVHAVPAQAAAGAAQAAAGAARHTTPVGDLTPTEQARLAAGLQLAPFTGRATGTDPFRGFLSTLRGVDIASWRLAAQREGRLRARSAALRAAQAAASPGGRQQSPMTYAESEPAGTAGWNDSVASGEHVDGFGLGAGRNNRVTISGTLADTRPPERTLLRAREDNGSIPLAFDTGIAGNGAVRIPGRIGDGPHASTGDGRGDFDWYKLVAKPGETIVADLRGTRVPSFAMITDPKGNELAVGLTFGSEAFPATPARYQSAEGGTYYVLIEGMSSWQNDPFDSGSGSGVGEEGQYVLTLGSWVADRDAYLVRLGKGDVLGATMSGSAHTLEVQKPDGTYVTGTTDSDLSSSYPPTSPLPGGGNATVAYVAEASGWYAVSAENGSGPYSIAVEAYRPGPESDPAPRVQTVYLDFDGATVDPGIFGGTPGSVKVSPLSAFLTKWGLTAADLPDLTDRITATVTENLATDVKTRGNNPATALTILNGLKASDIFGQPNVAKVVVGGTVKQTGIDTIGIAQFIDPGNYSQEDQALILLDYLSAAAGPDSSLNTYLRPTSNRIAFVGTALGNVISHEIGHLVGNYHTDNADTVTSLMDAGGAGFWRLFGTGRDKIGGTADDSDTDLTTDRFMPSEPFIGWENTLNVAAWGFSAHR